MNVKDLIVSNYYYQDINSIYSYIFQYGNDGKALKVNKDGQLLNVYTEYWGPNSYISITRLANESEIKMYNTQMIIKGAVVLNLNKKSFKSFIYY
jgi:hypothetical protein